MLLQREMGQNQTSERPSGIVDLASAQTRCGNALRTASRYHIGRDISEDYDVDTKVLGRGMTGEVKLARRRADPTREYAVKSFSISLFKKDHAAHHEHELLRTEAEVYLTLDHPNIARLHDVYEDKENIHLVMENCKGGELLQEVQTRKDRYSEPEAAEALTQMLRAVAYLHSQNVVHRDLKLENFLYQCDGIDDSTTATLKLIDFGFAKHWDPSTRMQAKCGSLHYVSPDVLSDSGYTSKCDCWSLGVITFMLLCGYPPFSGEGRKLLHQIMRGKPDIREYRWKHVSELGREFINRLLQKNPVDRMSAQEAIHHPWLLTNTKQLKPRMPRVSSNGLRSLAAYAEASHLQRAAVQLIAQELSDNETEELRQAFYSLDLEREGSVRAVDLKDAIRRRKSSKCRGSDHWFASSPRSPFASSHCLTESPLSHSPGTQSPLLHPQSPPSEQEVMQPASDWVPPEGPKALRLWAHTPPHDFGETSVMSPKSAHSDADAPGSPMSKRANGLRRANSSYLLNLCSMIDMNKDDRIDYTDFVGAMMATRMSEEELGHAVLAAFQRFDVDRSGYISTDDLKAILGGTGALVEEELQDVIREADLRYNGSISYDQFAAIVQGLTNADNIDMYACENKEVSGFPDLGDKEKEPAEWNPYQEMLSLVNLFNIPELPFGHSKSEENERDSED